LIITPREIDAAVAILDDVLNIIEHGSENLSECVPKNQRSGPFIERLNGSLSPAQFLQKIWTTPPKRWVKKLGAWS
jgi:hypothetical protein